MRDMLAEIVEKKVGIVADAKRRMPLSEVQERLTKGSFAMAQKFKNQSWSLIAECKLQSPSKGNFGHPYSVVQLAEIYAENGASMLSVHTDPHFLGKNEDVTMVRGLVDIPLLRKDFVIDEYQLYEARMLGADAVLLIARILTLAQLQEYLGITHSLGMNALVEVHDEADMEMAQATSAAFIGINNRNLKTFSTSIQNTLDLLPYADKSRTVISESGIHSLDEVKLLQAAGLKGILVGEGLATAPDVGKQTRDFSCMWTRA